MRVIPLTIVLLALMPAAAWSASRAQCVAHRGDGKSAPENTVPAFVSAARKGARMIEFDVQLSRDGELVLMHDASVDRTTNGHGKVSDLSFAELRALDAGAWFSPRFAGTRIPTLAEALAAIPRGILLNVHLKNSPAVARATARVIKEMGRAGDCFLACTAAQAEEAKAFVPGIRICNMSGQRSDMLAYANETIRLKTGFIQLLGDPAPLAQAVELLHRHNVAVNYFGAQEEELLKRLAATGVDYILTDDLDLCQSVLGK